MLQKISFQALKDMWSIKEVESPEIYELVIVVFEMPPGLTEWG